MKASFFVAWITLLCSNLCAFAQLERTVILLSVDGFSASYLADPLLKTIWKLKERASYAQSLKPVFPTLTFPNHLTLATGCYPGRHGIVANRFLDKTRGEFTRSDDTDWLECEPIWVSAERQKIKTAVAQWPLSYKKWNGMEASYHDEAFEKLSDQKVLEQLLFWLGLSGQKRPRLLMAYLTGVDGVGHDFGPESIEVKARTRRFDSTLKWFLEKLEALKDIGSYTVVIVSDHGMAKVEKSVSITEFFSKAKIGGVPIISGPLLFIYLWDPFNRSHVASLFSGFDHVHAFPTDQTPQEWGPIHSRMGDVIVIADPPTIFLWNKREASETQKGAHGYDSKEGSMGGIFMAWGSGIKRQKKLNQVLTIDVAATLANLLKINPPKDNQGNPIEEILTED